MQSQISLFFDENFGLQSLRFKFWRLPPVSNEFFVLKNIFFCLDIWRFLFTLLCGVSKGLMKTLKAFKKPFEASQRRVTIKFYANFYSNIIFKNARDEKGEDKDSDNKDW